MNLKAIVKVERVGGEIERERKRESARLHLVVYIADTCIDQGGLS